jgi:hypothetical protein
MSKLITCFIPASGTETDADLIDSLQLSGSIKETILLAPPTLKTKNKHIICNHLWSTKTIKHLAQQVETPYTLIITQSLPLNPSPLALERFIQVADDTQAVITYADYWIRKDNQLVAHPLIDYQKGSLRDDFNFGSMLLLRTDVLKAVANEMRTANKYAGMYELRLGASRMGNIVRIPEPLYTTIEADTRASGDQQFDYVNPRNREVQIEMEEVCTTHLKIIDAWLSPDFTIADLKSHPFSTEATVVIPVRNRERTIAEAVKSVLMQKTSFPFNLIVVNNHSTDGTTVILNELAKTDDRLIHLVPDRHDLGIGGCWNHAVHHPQCGRFAIQLDSDDLYIDDNVIQRIVDAFYQQQCAMVVGSYQMVNFNLEPIAPGLIDHREWTPENGRNNALRINGLGAPRAFFTPVLRQVMIPNVSYGEDYAVGLRISRNYQIGRIYEPLYLCRRWEDNSDAALDISRLNTYNYYKDRIRTIELEARLKMNISK